MDDITYGFLKNFINGRSLSVYDLSVLLDLSSEQLISPVKSLIENKYIQPAFPATLDNLENIPTDMRFVITYTGNKALILHKQEKRKFGFSELRAWLTLLIAIAAFIKSFFF